MIRHFTKICLFSVNADDMNRYLRNLAVHIYLQCVFACVWGSNVCVKEGIASIIRKKIPCLKEIDIVFCVGDLSGAISESLLENQYKSFRISFCKVGEEGAAILSQILQSSQCNLEELSLRGSVIGNSGCAAIMNALNCNSTLRILRLFDNNIGAEGCQAIASVLQKHMAPTLEELLLDRNEEIGDEGCIFVANALNDNTSLKILSLARCSISCHGWSVMEQTLQEKNYTLREMTIDEDSTFRKSFDELLSLNRKRPVEAEIRKTGMFPHRLIKNCGKGGVKSVCTIEILLKIMCFGSLSGLFSFVQANPAFFDF